MNPGSRERLMRTAPPQLELGTEAKPVGRLPFKALSRVRFDVTWHSGASLEPISRCATLPARRQQVLLFWGRFGAAFR